MIKGWKTRRTKWGLIRATIIVTNYLYDPQKLDESFFFFFLFRFDVKSFSFIVVKKSRWKIHDGLFMPIRSEDFERFVFVVFCPLNALIHPSHRRMSLLFFFFDNLFFSSQQQRVLSTVERLAEFKRVKIKFGQNMVLWKIVKVGVLGKYRVPFQGNC